MTTNDTILISGIEFPANWQETAEDWIDRFGFYDCWAVDVNGKLRVITQWADDGSFSAR